MKNYKDDLKYNLCLGIAKERYKLKALTWFKFKARRLARLNIKSYTTQLNHLINPYL